MTGSNWHIVGDDELAHHLRAAALHIDIPGPLTVVTSGGSVPAGAVATGRAVLDAGAELVVPTLMAFPEVNDIARAVRNAEDEVVYGCYGSYRLPRGSSPEEVELDALLPLLAACLEIVDLDVTDVWARRASLLDEGDAWFATIHCGAVLLTLEAMATAEEPPPNDHELVIEVTGSDQLHRAEPFSQPATAQTDALPDVWTGVAEQLLRRIVDLETRPFKSPLTRLRAAWDAVQQSARTGQPVTL